MQVPTKEEFLRQTEGGRAMPVYRDVLADVETPLSAYWKLAHDETYSFLLESVTGGEQLARYSLIGVRPKAVLRTKGEKGRRITRSGQTQLDLQPGEDPLDLLQRELPAQPPLDLDHTTKFVGGAVGMLSYDFVRFLERLPDGQLDDLNMDDMAMMLTEAVVVFDHAKNLIRIIVVAEGSSEGYEQACAEIERIVGCLRRPLPTLPGGKFASHDVVANMSPEQYQEGVRACIEYITAGDGIQMVLSQRFARKNDAHPVAIYRALRSLNPSPYLFLLRFGDFDLVGASPELLVSLEGSTCRVRPIAGTRWRGKTPQEDAALAEDLLADEKERAEHIMLVDLGRNDLGRVSEFGSVKVNELMTVERYSHVMHIVSDVTGTLRSDMNAFDLLRATFPAGTVSGAPKVRAMEIIEELEPTRRGTYAGCIGYVSLNGDMDMAITIRTILLKDGMAYVQAGAGIVYDSVPEREHQECRNKAQAALRALEIAASGELGVL